MFKNIKNLTTLLVNKYNYTFCLKGCSNVSQKLNENEKGSFQLDLSFEENALRSIFPLIRNEVIEEQLIFHNSLPELKERYLKLLHYTLDVDTKFLSRGMLLIYMYRTLEKPSLLTPERLKKAYILAWAHKLMDASILIDDDIVDESNIRYNKSTWFKLEDVGKNLAIFDAAFLETGAHLLLLNHLSFHPQYVNIQKELFKCYYINNVAQITEARKLNLADFDENQNFTKLYPFTITLMSSALYLANIDDRDIHKATEEFCIEVARYLKIEDDIICIFNPLSDTQKECTDVPLGRASWLAIEAYKRATPNQRQILEKHYGRENNDSVLKIYDIFSELKLEEEFYKYKQEFYEKQILKIKEMPKTLPIQLFSNLLQFVMSGNCRV